MHVALLANPIAGRGRALGCAQLIADELERSGIRASINTQPERGFDGTTHPDLAVAVGGDGTLHRWLPALIQDGIPAWHAPLGTENLFARHYGMSREPDDIRRALRANRTARHDLGRFDGTPFAIMASLGPDAAIVRDVNFRRTGRVSRLSYGPPTLRHLRSGHAGRYRLVIDGDPPVERAGMLVVAVLPGYGGWLNPAWEADPHDGLLTAVHIPGRTARTVGFRLACSWMRDASAIPGRECWHARTIEIEPISDTPAQVDGDPIEPSHARRIRCELLPGALRVLLPAT